MATLRELREENYISRRELAEAAGVSDATIVRMEEGKIRTTNKVAEKVLTALSEKIGQTVTLDTIEGLNLYNVMRDRRKQVRRKGKEEKLPDAA
jgi:predicted transcriptional regulator